jgi:hypothetical protein
LVVLCACATPPPGNSPGITREPAGITREEAEQVLTEQAGKWNEGDLEGFVGTYWDGPELSFLGERGITRGRADLLAQYRRGYPDAAARGVLTFDVLEFRPLGSDHAMLLGRFHIARQQPAHGFFTLILARQGGRLVILHDHTTAAK